MGNIAACARLLHAQGTLERSGDSRARLGKESMAVASSINNLATSPERGELDEAGSLCASLALRTSRPGR